MGNKVKVKMFEVTVSDHVDWTFAVMCLIMIESSHSL